MKKLLAITVALLMVITLTACGGGNEKKIIGMWQIVDTETETEYGMGIEFTEDGKMRYGLTEDSLEGLTGGEATSEDWADAMEGLEALMSIEYEIKSDTEMEITMSAFLGLAKETASVTYKLDGDTLTFDGATYSRVK